MSNRRLILIPVAIAQDVRDYFELHFDPVGAQEMFRIRLGPTQFGTETHSWANSTYSPEQITRIEGDFATTFPTAVIREYDMDTQPTYPDDVLVEFELVRMSNVGDD